MTEIKDKKVWTSMKQQMDRCYDVKVSSFLALAQHQVYKNLGSEEERHSKCPVVSIACGNVTEFTDERKSVSYHYKAIIF